MRVLPERFFIQILLYYQIISAQSQTIFPYTAIHQIFCLFCCHLFQLRLANGRLKQQQYKVIKANLILLAADLYGPTMKKVSPDIKKHTHYNCHSADESKTFPLIPDQIHKVPESIRKALKVGKHRKNINPSNNNSNSATNNYRVTNPEFNEAEPKTNQPKNKKQEDLHVRQIFTFLPKAEANNEEYYTRKQLMQSQKQKQTVASKFFRSEFGKLRNSGDRILYAKRKLSPIKSGLTVQHRSLASRDKRNLKVTFLNVQKLKLVKISDHFEKQKMEQNKSSVVLANSLQNKNMMIENFLESTNLSNKNSFLRKSFFDKSPSKVTLKPFSPPFQKYHYRDFIWKCAFSFNVFHESPQAYCQKFKIFVGKGNNSMLLKSLMKRRKAWWVFTDKYDEANMIWTQIKINNVFSAQKNQAAVYHQDQPFCPQPKPERQLTPLNLLNLKILNPHDHLHWQEYFKKFRRAEDTLDESMRKRNRVFTNLNNKLSCKHIIQLDLKTIKVHNHLPNNYIISNKKALFYTMSKYYQNMKQDVFQYLPLTFHIQNGLEDPQYLKFLNSFYERAKKIKARQRVQQIQTQQKQVVQPASPSRVSTQNMWIVKPGEFTNRGNGITVCMNLNQIKAILKKKQRHDDGNLKTYIIQSYLEKPFLYQKRKFDIRHYMMIVSINGIIKGYWYQLGYIRTTSFEYTIKHGLTSVHLTNDAVQKYLPEYGKYEKGNKISYEEFQKYLDKQYDRRYNFYNEVYPKMKKIATDSIKACSLMIDSEKKGHNFEIFGMDFMIDGDFHPWLIQINNNPCLELSCPLLGQIIPPMVENALKIGLDSIIPPPMNLNEKKSRFDDNVLQNNKFELVYDSTLEQKQMMRIFNGKCKLELDYRELEKDQDEVYDDDGVELED